MCAERRRADNFAAREISSSLSACSNQSSLRRAARASLDSVAKNEGSASSASRLLAAGEDLSEMTERVSGLSLLVRLSGAMDGGFTQEAFIIAMIAAVMNPNLRAGNEIVKDIREHKKAPQDGSDHRPAAYPNATDQLLERLPHLDSLSKTVSAYPQKLSEKLNITARGLDKAAHRYCKP